MFRPALFSLVVFVLSACAGDCQSLIGRDDNETPPQQEYGISNSAIDESSGLAFSQFSSEILWTHNDSAGAAKVYALDSQAAYLGQLLVSAATNVDWEDMASFSQQGQARLLLADIGDNRAVRRFVTLYIVDEPAVPVGDKSFELEVAPLRTIQLTYPDGPRDAEAVAVDAKEGFIYLLTKRDAVPQLYRVPLESKVSVLVAEALGDIAIPRASADTKRPNSFNFITAMDMRRDGRALVVVSYTHAYLYRRQAQQSWAQALQQSPQAYDLPKYRQIEAVSFAPDGNSIWITSEGESAPLARMNLRSSD